MNSKKIGLLTGLVISGFVSVSGFIIGFSLFSTARNNFSSPNNSIPLMNLLNIIGASFVYLAFAAGIFCLILFMYLTNKLLKFNKTLAINSLNNKTNGSN